MTIASQKVPDVAALATQKKFHTALNRSIATWKLENEGWQKQTWVRPITSQNHPRRPTGACPPDQPAHRKSPNLVPFHWLICENDFDAISRTQEFLDI
jgi:hypothetical protein